MTSGAKGAPGRPGGTPERPATYFADAAELREEIAITIVHEAGHHIGIDEERLHELGWG